MKCCIIPSPWLMYNAMFYRFLKDDLVRLSGALQLPPKYVCCTGTSASGIEALMILLQRLSYPNRWGDLVPLFGRAEPELSVIFSEVSYIIPVHYKII